MINQTKYRAGFYLVRALVLTFALFASAACASRPPGISEPINAPVADSPAETGGIAYALPRTVLKIEATMQSNVVTYVITPSIVPDPDARFLLRYAPSDWAANTLSIAVNDQGLLTSGSSSVQDQTGAVVVQLARTAGAAVGLAGGIPPRSIMRVGRPVPPARPARPAPNPYPFTRIITPAEAAGTNGIELPDEAVFRLEGYPAAAVSPPTCPFSLCYRAPLSLRASIRSPASRDRRVTEAQINIVDTTRTLGVNLNPAPLVTRVNTLAFSNGLFTSYQANQPSVALAAASLPLDALTAFFDGLGSILTLRVKNSTSQAELINQQALLATRQRELLTAEQALVDARAAAARASGDAP